MDKHSCTRMGFGRSLVMNCVAINFDNQYNPIFDDNKVWFNAPVFCSTMNKHRQRGKRNTR